MLKSKILQLFNSIKGDLVAGDKIQYVNKKTDRYYREILDILEHNLVKRIELHKDLRKKIVDIAHSGDFWWLDTVIEGLLPQVHQLGQLYEKEIIDFIQEIKDLSPNVYKQYIDLFKFEVQTRESLGQLIFNFDSIESVYGSNFFALYAEIIRYIEDEGNELKELSKNLLE